MCSIYYAKLYVYRVKRFSSSRSRLEDKWIMSACIRFSGNAVGGYIPASNLAAIVSAAVLQGINPVKGIKSLFGSQARETLASALLEAAPSEKTILDSLIGKL